MALTGTTNSEKIFWYFNELGMPLYGICGLIGNLDCESGLNPKNLEDAYEKKSGFTDDSYVTAVDGGKYKNFINDAYGFGLAQWTWWTRKQNLYNFAKARGASIGDMEIQLDFLKKELQESYPSVWKTLMNAKSVCEASNAVLLRFECPTDQSVSVQNYRASIGQKYYEKFKNLTKNTVTNGETIVMGYYAITKGSKQKLSNSFYSYEFDCHGSGCCSQTKINETLVKYLQAIRDHFGKPITITSAYRCPVHNANVNGATGSRHCAGDAADIVVQGVTPRIVAQYAESIGILGIGLYETQADGFFVHIDTRTYKSYWYGQSQSPRTTFGGSTSGNATAPGNSTNSNSGLSILSVGSKGAAVKELQENLIKLGYSCGGEGADGVFGYGTSAAVRKFQKNHNIGVDGIVGYQTMTAINKAISALDKEKNDSGDTVTVTASLLNVRAGAGLKYKILARIRKGTVCKVTEEENGWGKISEPEGWVCLDYCEKK